MLSGIEDESRFKEIIKAAIDRKAVPLFKAFAKDSEKEQKKRQQKYAKEAAEAEQIAKKLELDSEAGLRALITQKRQDRADSLLASLEKRYGGSGRSVAKAAAAAGKVKAVKEDRMLPRVQQLNQLRKSFSLHSVAYWIEQEAVN